MGSNIKCPGKWQLDGDKLVWFGDIENTDENPISTKVFEIDGAKVRFECLAAQGIEPGFQFDVLEAYDFVVVEVEEDGQKTKMWWSDLEKRPWYQKLVEAFKDAPETNRMKTSTTSEMIAWWRLPMPS